MRLPPKDAIFSSDDMSAYMVQPWRVTHAEATFAYVIGAFSPGKTPVHFDMIEQRRAVSRQALAIQDASLDREGSRCVFCVEQQEKREQQWNVVRDSR
jgi:hypothetical protein